MFCKAPCGSFTKVSVSMASRREKQKEEVRFRVVRLLNENPKISTRKIATKVGISNGSAYYCLNALVKTGLVKWARFSSSKNKSNYAYMLTPSGIKEKAVLTKEFLRIKIIEYNELRNEIDKLELELDHLELDKQSRSN